MKHKCIECGSIPDMIWSYMPSYQEYCDNCVPRGCSCNVEPKVNPDLYESWDSKNPDDYAEKLDEKGRKYPCCEYWWTENDFDYEQEFKEEDKS